MRLFQLLQLAKEPVVLGVRERRRIEHVVAIVGLAKLLAQLLDAWGDCHRPEILAGGGAARGPRAPHWMVTVPVSLGWKSHWYGYVPGPGKPCGTEFAPGGMSPVTGGPVAPVAVWS